MTTEIQQEKGSSSSKRGGEETGSHVSITPKLKQWIEKIASDAGEGNASEELRLKCEDYLQTPPRCVPLSVVQRVADYASGRREQGKTPKARNSYLDDFLAGAKWFFAEGPPLPKRDRDSESTVERIRNDAANREYERMTKNLGGTLAKKSGEGIGSFAADLKSANKEAIAAFNCLLSVIGAFVFAYFATGMVVEDNVIAQVMVAVVVSTIVAAADVYFLIKKLHHDELKASGLDKPTKIPTAFDLHKKSKDV
ncbi:hypothetical protein BV898_07954 [Hypsibius exemplaris]|uniref:Transmembrane protein 199 n=1 Tax=Hypsibius exemplaris TaxID=2072580 RepID=A0A1W0WS90_HYPEX|nr:hypothetical protein BV898_07954 [Hypsibius exemplaris]